MFSSKLISEIMQTFRMFKKRMPQFPDNFLISPMKTVNGQSRMGGGGGYSHTLPVRVCAAQRGRDFEAPDLERGIHFSGVF